jgi:hypothetical protein
LKAPSFSELHVQQKAFPFKDLIGFSHFKYLEDFLKYFAVHLNFINTGFHPLYHLHVPNKDWRSIIKGATIGKIQQEAEFSGNQMNFGEEVTGFSPAYRITFTFP